MYVRDVNGNNPYQTFQKYKRCNIKSEMIWAIVFAKTVKTAVYFISLINKENG